MIYPFDSWGFISPFEEAWSIIKAPLFTREPMHPAYLQHLRNTGVEPEVTSRLVQIQDGEETRPIQQPKRSNEKFSFPRLDQPRHKGSPLNPQEKKFSGRQNPNFSHFYESPDKNVRAGIVHHGDNVYSIDSYAVREGHREQGLGRAGLDDIKSQLEQYHGGDIQLISNPSVRKPEAEGVWNKVDQDQFFDE
jgi:hypothetical protein